MENYELIVEYNHEVFYLDLIDDSGEIDNWINEKHTKYLCSKLLSILTDTEYEVINLYFGLSDDNPKNYEEISKIMNLNKKVVSRLSRNSLRKMRNPRNYYQLFINYTNFASEIFD